MNESLTPQTTMRRVLEIFPGAQRALFRRFHVGGCASCGFPPEETLEALCRRNNLNAPEVIQHIASSHQQDQELLIAPRALAALRQQGPVRLVDIRTREEFEAARIQGAVFFSQPLMQEILGRWPRSDLIVIYDHLGRQSLDAAAFFLGHGFSQVRCLLGGIDAWSTEADPAVPRYDLEYSS
ncbi:MAG: rhodanese-like domain-containing protein [Verrucomicrobiota bacterium]|jgi:rhodanese-related sulfurtransferase